MARKLTITKLNAVHLVDKGAAVSPRVLVIKRAASRAEEKTMPMKDQIAEAISKALDQVFAKVDKTPQQLLEEALTPIKDDATRSAILAAVAAMYQSQPPAPAPTPAKQEEPKEPEAPAEGEGEGTPVGEEKPPVEDEKKKTASKRKAGKDLDNVLKVLKPEERAVVEAAIKDKDEEIVKRQALETEVKELQEEVAKGKAADEMKAELEVAKQFPFVPGDVKKRAGVLLSIRKQDPKAYEEMVGQLKAANELISKGRKSLDAKGTSRFEGDEGGDGDDGVSASEKLDRMAKEMLSKAIEKGDTKLTYEICYARVAKAHPELLARTHKEN